jgi:hypothetical protein
MDDEYVLTGEQASSGRLGFHKRRRKGEMGNSAVFKFDVPKTGRDGYFMIPLPEDAIVRHFGYDGRGQLCVWVEIPNAGHAKRMPGRKFQAVTTGAEFPPEGRNYICTVIQQTSVLFETLVAHIYEIQEA